MNNLKYIRKHAHLTQKDVAEMTGLDRSNYALIELDKRPITVRTLLALTNLFSCSAGYLLGMDNEWIEIFIEGYPKPIRISEGTYQMIGNAMTERPAYLGKTFVIETKYKAEILGGYKVMRYLEKGKLADLLTKREVVRELTKTISEEQADKIIELLR